MHREHDLGPSGNHEEGWGDAGRIILPAVGPVELEIRSSHGYESVMGG